MTYAQMNTAYPLPNVGQMAMVTDSTTKTTGAVVAGGGANPVLAVYVAGDWHVAVANGSGSAVVNVRKSDNSGPCTITYNNSGSFISTTCP